MIIVAAVSLLVIGGAAFGVWKVFDMRSEISTLKTDLDNSNSELENLKNDIVTDPNSVVSRLQQEQNSSILEEIAQVYAVPEDETPTIATVEDISKLADQPFFEGAENGDILVVFDKSAQAILYRPSTQKLVKVGPISSGTGTPTTTEASTPSAEE